MAQDGTSWGQVVVRDGIYVREEVLMLVVRLPTAGLQSPHRAGHGRGLCLPRAGDEQLGMLGHSQGHSHGAFSRDCFVFFFAFLGDNCCVHIYIYIYVIL